MLDEARLMVEHLDEVSRALGGSLPDHLWIESPVEGEDYATGLESLDGCWCRLPGPGGINSSYVKVALAESLGAKLNLGDVPRWQHMPGGGWLLSSTYWSHAVSQERVPVATDGIMESLARVVEWRALLVRAARLVWYDIPEGTWPEWRYLEMDRHWLLGHRRLCARKEHTASVLHVPVLAQADPKGPMTESLGLLWDGLGEAAGG